MPNQYGQKDIFDTLMTSPNPYANAASLQALFRDYVGVARIPFQINQTDLVAHTVQDFVAPFNGSITDLVTTVETAIGTDAGGTIKVQVGTTDVTNCVVAISTAATKGTRARARTQVTPFVPGADTSNLVSKGDRVTLTPATFGTAGAVNGYIEITPR